MIRRFAFLVTVFLMVTPGLPAQPVVSAGGVLNVASYSYSALPGGSIAQGSMFTVFGSGLGTTSSGALSFPLQTTMDGASIQVTSGSTTVNAYMIYTTPGQIAGILPSNTPTGAATLTVTYNSQASKSVSIQVVSSSFGAFTQNQGGSGPGIIQDYVSATELPVNSIVSPAYPGQTVILWGTGLGPIPGTDADAGPPPTTNMQSALNVQVWVGNKPATVTYAGRSGCCAAIDQVDFVVPQGVQGCYVPVAVKAGSAGILSNFPSMAIAPSAGANCSDADGIEEADVKTLESKGSVSLGMVSLLHIELNVNAAISLSAFSDTANSIFGTYSTEQLSASLGLTQSPSVGYCTVSQFLGLNPVPVDPIKPSGLDAGASLSISGPGGSKTIPATSTGFYSATLGGVDLDEILTGSSAPAYFSPGTYTISGAGSSVGSFSQTIPVPANLTWTNSTITTVDRTQPLTINWSGAAQGDFVAIAGLSLASPGPLGPTTTSPGDLFLCVAPGSANSFTVPAFVVEALPPSSTESPIPTSFLLVGTQTPAIQFSASGLDDGYLLYRTLTGGNVTIQ